MGVRPADGDPLNERVDDLLRKISEGGLASLSADERARYLARADEALAAGRDLLEKQSTSLNDDDVRNSLRQKIPAHRDILAI